MHVHNKVSYGGYMILKVFGHQMRQWFFLISKLEDVHDTHTTERRAKEVLFGWEVPMHAKHSGTDGFDIAD